MNVQELQLPAAVTNGTLFGNVSLPFGNNSLRRASITREQRRSRENLKKEVPTAPRRLLITSAQRVHRFR